MDGLSTGVGAALGFDFVVSAPTRFVRSRASARMVSIGEAGREMRSVGIKGPSRATEKYVQFTAAAMAIWVRARIGIYRWLDT
jgi:hypothetical protein